MNDGHLVFLGIMYVIVLGFFLEVIMPLVGDEVAMFITVCITGGFFAIVYKILDVIIHNEKQEEQNKKADKAFDRIGRSGV